MTTLRRAIMTTVQEQLYWNDVKEGDNLPEFELDLTWTKMVEQVSGSQDFYEVHHDPDLLAKPVMMRFSTTRVLHRQPSADY